MELGPEAVKDIYDMKLIKPWAKMMQAIPISSGLRPLEMIWFPGDYGSPDAV